MSSIPTNLATLPAVMEPRLELTVKLDRMSPVWIDPLEPTEFTTPVPSCRTARISPETEPLMVRESISPEVWCESRTANKEPLRLPLTRTEPRWPAPCAMTVPVRSPPTTTPEMLPLETVPVSEPVTLMEVIVHEPGLGASGEI